MKVLVERKEMENPTSSAASQARRKNNFSIENILARPDNSNVEYRENRDVKIVKFMRQNPFQNNHVLFNHQNSSMINNYNKNNRESRKISEEEIKHEEEAIVEIVEGGDDNESHSEIASDDGNSISGNCEFNFIILWRCSN